MKSLPHKCASIVPVVAYDMPRFSVILPTEGQEHQLLFEYHDY
jgi:hypothetical protein